jgi:hypothetical protein
MLRLTERRRAILADKFADVGNLAAAALVFGQAISGDTFSPVVGLAGTALWIVFIAVAYALSGEGP